MKAISDKHYEMMHPTPLTPPAQGLLDVNVAGIQGVFGTIDSPFSTTPLHINISVPPSLLFPLPLFQDAWSGNVCYTPTDVSILSAGTACQRGEPHDLHTVNPTAMFRSLTATPLWSTCVVFANDDIVHVDQPMVMNLKEDSTFNGTFQYFTVLSPGYWGVLCSVPGELNAIKDVGVLLISCRSFTVHNCPAD